VTTQAHSIDYNVNSTMASHALVGVKARTFAANRQGKNGVCRMCMPKAAHTAILVRQRSAARQMCFKKSISTDPTYIPYLQTGQLARRGCSTVAVAIAARRRHHQRQSPTATRFHIFGRVSRSASRADPRTKYSAITMTMHWREHRSITIEQRLIALLRQICLVCLLSP
jgi:hypothetical protein